MTADGDSRGSRRPRPLGTGTVPLVVLSCCAAVMGPHHAADTLFADLPPEVTAAVDSALDATDTEEGPLDRLDAVLEVAPTYAIAEGPIRLETDRRWFATRPPADPGAPFLEFRRWPGDSVLALWAIEGPPDPERPPTIPGATLAPAPAGGDAVAWSGRLRGGTGERPAVWLSRAIPDSSHHLAGLLLPGDAGLGADAVGDRLDELRALWRRIGIDPNAWAAVPRTSGDVAVIVPDAGVAPVPRTEKDDPWQLIEGGGFSMSVPPGVRARMTLDGVTPPLSVPGQLAWFRGRFVDAGGLDVVLGDSLRAGYLAAIDEDPGAWFENAGLPLGIAAGERLASQPFDVAADRAGAEAARAERWNEPGFAGEWLIFRMRFAQFGLEFGMPVVSGAKSASLYWIPVTWRGAGRGIAQPPEDPMTRFGITFSRLSGAARSQDPWIEGYLEVPGLLVRVPRGWMPAASLRTGDGYPIRLVGPDGADRGIVTRIVPGALPAPGDGWSESRRLGGKRAAATWTHEDGRVLLVAKEGHAFLFSPSPYMPSADEEIWQRVLDGLQVLKDR